MHIGLTYDLQADYLAMGYSHEAVAEFDYPETVAAIELALRSRGHTTERIGHIQALVQALAQGKRWELVFNIAEGMHGLAREAQVPALLDAYGIPYVFSDPLVLALTLNKGLTKRVIRDAGLPTADFVVVHRLEETAEIDLPYPLFAKPVAEGTSKGISPSSRIEDPEQLTPVCAELLARYRQPVLVETYLPGREFTVGVLGTGPDARVLGALEVTLNNGADSGFYSFHNKDHYDSLVRYTLARDQDALAASEVALEAWRVLGCRDGGRVDLRLDAAGIPNFMEVNPLAGLHPVRSDLIILARQLGMDHPILIGQILQSALDRVNAAGPAAEVRQHGTAATGAGIGGEVGHVPAA